MTITTEKTLTEIKIIDTKEKVYKIEDLEKELNEIDKQIKETDKEPNEVLMPNFEKEKMLEDLNIRKKEIEGLLK